jgi:signal transduction histidine kinase
MSGIAAPTQTALGRTTRLPSALGVSLAVCLATVVAVGLAIVSAPGNTPKIAVPVLLVGTAVVFGVGFSDLAHARDVRFARALLAAGLLWTLSALAASSNPALYSVGRVSQWFVDLAIVYLLLAYPSGRLADRTDRALFAAAALVVGLLYLPTALIVQHFPSPSPWTTCTSGCPGNAIALGHSTPALIQDLVVPVRELLSVALFLAVVVIVKQRGENKGPLLRRLYAPIAFIAFYRTLALAIYFLTRRVDPGSSAMQVVSWTYMLSLPAVALASVAGHLYPRLFAANALDRIARVLRSGAMPADVSRAMGDALEDPSLRVLHSFPDNSGAWVDESGSPVALPQPAVQHEVTEVSSGSWRIAIVHDPALAEDPALVRTAGSYALAALENHHLSGELRSSLRELAESRASRVAAERRERQKIERDLHDGAQQRLVAVRVKLGLAADLVESDGLAAVEAIRALGEDIDATIAEVRSLAQGIYPPVLAERGLTLALRAAGRGAALPTTVLANGLRRYSAEIEATVYFSCSEALQNAAKHALGATGVTISVWQDDDLQFQVSDDGAGFDVESTPPGTGLSNLGDRLAAVGGTMRIQTAPGEGTVVGGSIPIQSAPGEATVVGGSIALK